MKRWIKSAVFFCLYYSGLEWLLARILPARSVAVLMYHGVCDKSALPPHIDFHVRRRDFERQMQVLKRRYPVIPLSQLVSMLKQGLPLKKSVVITFDDGYRNNLTCAAPILQQLALPFAVFTATAFIGTENWMPLNVVYARWACGQLSMDQVNDLRRQLRTSPSSERPRIMKSLAGLPDVFSPEARESFAMLDWNEVRALTAAGAEVGSHTHSHCNMASEAPSQQIEELQESRDLLEKHLETPIRLFAYPYGHSEQMSDQTRRSVVQAGFECAISAEYGLVTSKTDRYSIPRLGYDRRIWFFAGEILYQFAKQAAIGVRSTRKQTRVRASDNVAMAAGTSSSGKIGGWIHGGR